MSLVKNRELTRHLLSALCTTSNNLEEVETLLTTLLTPVQFPTNRVLIPSSTTGSVADGFKSFTISNIGGADALVDSVIFPAGFTETYSANGKNETVSGIDYNSQSSELLITTIG